MLHNFQRAIQLHILFDTNCKCKPTMLFGTSRSLYDDGHNNIQHRHFPHNVHKGKVARLNIDNTLTT
jgi:hypothetical protein